MRSATGGPAFPVPGLQHDEDFNGMSLRDYFAAKALQGIAGSPLFVEWKAAEIARCAYTQADAMLAARGAA